MQVASAAPIVALLAGAAAGLAWPASVFALVVALLIGASLALGAFWRGHLPAFVIGLCAACAAGGAVLAVRAWDDAWMPSLRVAFDREVGDADSIVGELTGVLQSDAHARDDAVALDVASVRLAVRGRGRGRTESIDVAGAVRDVRGGVRLSVAGGLAASHLHQWRAGRTIRATVRLRRPSPHRNPGGVDESRALARRGVALLGSVKSASLVEVVSRGSWRTEAAARARATVRRVVARHVGRWDPAAAGIVTAILIGDRTGLTPTTERLLQEAGTYHVIAISGGNVAIFAVLTVGLFRWAGVLGRTAMVAAIGLFVAYGQVVEGGASVDRAIAVAVLAFAVRALDHRLHPLRGLAVAAGGLVVVDPLAVADPGFLLSFGATLGILIVAPLATRAGAGPVLRVLGGMLVASVAAELVLLPILASIFGRITVAGVALNYLAIPLMSVVQVAGLLTIPLGALAPLAADGVGWVAATSAAWLVDSASLVTWVPVLAWRVARPSTWAVAGYYVSVAAALVVWWHPGVTGGVGTAERLGPRVGARLRKPRAFLGRLACAATARSRIRRGCAIAAVAAGLWIAAEPWTLWAGRGDGRLRVISLDVGQGDATLLRFPAGATMLVDAGGTASATYDIGDRVVVPALRHLGVRRLGTVVLTHGDADHIGGAPAVVRELRPFDIWDGVPVPRLPARQALRAIAAARGARWAQVQRGDVVTIDGVEVHVHHPAPPDWERQDPRNDDSIVIELRWRDVSIVLPGDISASVEAMLLESFAPARRRVLKVPHHGSATSSSGRFLERLRPDVAIVSAGPGNVFGHPAPSVVGRLEALGAAIYRTDRDGAVTVTTDGHDLEVDTVVERATR